jgi:hypothetical protein
VPALRRAQGIPSLSRDAALTTKDTKDMKVPARARTATQTVMAHDSSSCRTRAVLALRLSAGGWFCDREPVGGRPDERGCTSSGAAPPRGAHGVRARRRWDEPDVIARRCPTCKTLLEPYGSESVRGGARCVRLPTRGRERKTTRRGHPGKFVRTAKSDR